MQLHQGVFVFCPWSKCKLPMVNMHFDAVQFEIGCGYVVIIVPVKKIIGKVKRQDDRQ